MSDSVPGSPPFRPFGRGRDWSRRCRGLSRCVAARDASAASRPRRVRHETRMDAWKRRWIASGCFVAMGLWPKRCVAGTARLDFAGSEPAGGMGGLLPHCRRIAALPLRDRGAVRSPRSSLPSVGTSPWPTGNQVWPVGVALAGCPRVALCADVAAPEAAVAPGTLRVTCTCRVVTRRSRARVPRFWRRCAVPLMRTRTGRSNVPLAVERAW